MIPTDLRKSLQEASNEYIAAMSSRPDDAASYYNLGNYYAARRNSEQAIQAYETSIKLRNDFILPYVNASLVYNRLGDNKTAAKRLEQAIAIDPNSNAAHLNLALLYGEMGRYKEAIKEFKTSFKLDPHSATAAYNLCILLAKTDSPQAIAWAKKACQLQPDNAKYGYTHGFYLYHANRITEAISALEPFVDQKTAEVNIYSLLGEIYERTGNLDAAIKVYKTASENQRLPDQIRSGFQAQFQRLAKP
jgi:tetratricopeptide (TPR) repeat protein